MKPDSETPSLIFQRIVPEYRKPVFIKMSVLLNTITLYSNTLRCSTLKNADGLDKETCFEKIPSFFYLNKPTSLFQRIIPVLRKHRPKLVIAEASQSYLTPWLLILLRPFFSFHIIGWGHGIGNKEIKNPFSGVQGTIKKFLYNRFDGFIAYSQNRGEILEACLNNVPVMVAPNTLDTSTFKLLFNQIEKQDRQEVKTDLGLQKKFNLLYIGRLVSAKRIDMLIKSFQNLKADNIQLHIIGTGPEEENLKTKAGKDESITFYGASFNQDWNAKMLYAADLLVNPGYVGLSIIHAMSFGCPVLTCHTRKDGPFHSPEFEYLRENYNCLLCEPNEKDISKSIEAFLNKNEHVEMRKNCLKTAYEEASVSKMIEGFNFFLKNHTK